MYHKRMWGIKHRVLDSFKYVADCEISEFYCHQSFKGILRDALSHSYILQYQALRIYVYCEGLCGNHYVTSQDAE